MPCRNVYRAFVLMVLLSFAAEVRSEVKLNSVFSEGVVLQQGVSVPIWGTAKDGEKISVEFQGQKVSTVGKDGRWLVRLKNLRPGGPFRMTVTGENTMTLTDVLVGEVWLASGQSNMAFGLARATNASEVIPAATDPQFHFFHVPYDNSDTPLTDVKGQWKQCTPDNVTNFSAVAYFFGRDLRKARQVPVGILESSVGGTPAESWVSRATLESDPELKKILERYAESIKAFEKTAAATNKPAAKPKTTAKGNPAKVDPRRTGKRPSALYNAMIAPLQPYAIAGVIWYQGEANSGRAKEYQTLFPALIRNWREAFGKNEFPFLFVQIAPNDRMSPEIREAQLLTAQRVPRTAMAVITDHGNPQDIHPKEKEPVGQRLALAARALAYGDKIEYSGPIFKSMDINGGEAVLNFTHVGGGLVTHGDELKGFEVAGEDGTFTDAVAKIAKDQVIVSAAGVSKPVVVRFGWKNAPEVNLFNAEGLPATPFRTSEK